MRCDLKLCSIKVTSEVRSWLGESDSGDVPYSIRQDRLFESTSEAHICDGLGYCV